MKKPYFMTVVVAVGLAAGFMLVPAFRAASRRAKLSHAMSTVQRISSKMSACSMNDGVTFPEAFTNASFRALLDEEENRFLAQHDFACQPSGSNDMTFLEVKTEHGTIVQYIDGSTTVRAD